MSGVFSANSGYVEEMFARYSRDPKSVSTEWRAYFEGFHEGFGTAAQIAENASELQGVLSRIADNGHATGHPNGHANGLANGSGAPAAVGATLHAGGKPASESLSLDALDFELKTSAIVDAYRRFGHLQARTNPLNIPPPLHPALTLEAAGLAATDLAKTTHAGRPLGLGPCTVAELVAALQAHYCGTVGAEIEHIADPEERAWLRRAFEAWNAPVEAATRVGIFKELARADALEKTLATKFIGKKRFSIEGSDAQIPAIETFIDVSAKLGTREFSVAMAHRGRLNILVHVAGKPLENLFAEFEGYPSKLILGDGDVKYHAGYESERASRSGLEVRVALSSNPSHLEFVDAVVVGETRARQVRYHDGDIDAVIPICLHGDAAFAGQGVVFETIQMMKLSGYSVGGTLHIVANNQVGFTTNPQDARSSDFSTDVAKVVQAPVFHVNADDLDALHNVMTLAAHYRRTFHKDVVIDLVCFRRHGHNETDEPRFTQPVLYKLVESKPAPYEHFLSELAKTPAPEFDRGALTAYYDETRARMNGVFDAVRAAHTEIAPSPRLRGIAGLRTHVGEDEMLNPVATAVPAEKLRALGKELVALPEGFTVNSKLARIILGERKDMVEEKRRIDWGMGELLAYASLLSEGVSVRLAGQDARRGTFSHRHGTLTDAENGQRFTALSNVARDGARVEIIDSHLSEMAAMGFEYGYAVQHDKALVLWEGQFGDFANGAQVIIDQFIAAGESKWGQTQGLVLLLPHGFEGQGPEHSSARLERFLQLSAQGNMQVCYFSNVGQLFHAFRRQVARDFRKPMIVMTPKSFLRNPRASTSFNELASGRFEEILDDARAGLNPKKVKRVILGTGKFAIDLFDALDKDEYKGARDEVAIVRIEQLYPLASGTLATVLKKYPGASSVVWAQEEPRNMGAASFLLPRIAHVIAQGAVKGQLQYVGRSERASPAVGLEKVHAVEQDSLIKAALTGASSFEA